MEVEVSHPKTLVQYRIRWADGSVFRKHQLSLYFESYDRAEQEANLRNSMAQTMAFEIEEFDTPIPAPRPRVCAGCGDITTFGRWCSNTCFVAEDGEPYDG